MIASSCNIESSIFFLMQSIENVFFHQKVLDKQTDGW